MNTQQAESPQAVPLPYTRHDSATHVAVRAAYQSLAHIGPDGEWYVGTIGQRLTERLDDVNRHEIGALLGDLRELFRFLDVADLRMLAAGCDEIARKAREAIAPADPPPAPVLDPDETDEIGEAVAADDVDGEPEQR